MRESRGAFIVISVFCATLAAEVPPAKRPVMDFSRPTASSYAYPRNAIKNIQKLDAAALRKLYVEEPRNYLKRAYSFECGAEYAVSMWQRYGDEQYRTLAVRAYRAALGDLLKASDEELRARISDRGSIDPQVFRMRDACHHFALLYYLTKEGEYAHKSAVLLARFGEQIPKWPIHNPYHKKQKTAYAQSDPKALSFHHSAGFWGRWIYEDILLGIPLARAYDLIYNSDEIQRMQALKEIESMLRLHMDTQLRFGANYTNMDMAQIRGILVFAKILGEPEYVHRCIKWMKDIHRVSFYADGWWKEGTPAYHRQIHGHLRRIAVSRLQGYSDPPGFRSKLDGTRFDNLDDRRMFGRSLKRADDALAGVLQPNGTYQAIHDADCRMRPSSPRPMTEARSHLFGCMGHAILGTGKGKGNMVQATLHFSGVHGHGHGDCLNIMLFAKGRELISETRYRPREATNSTREWHVSTAGHVTVMVDGKEQPGWNSRYIPKRKKQPEDAVPGIPDWGWRWEGLGDNMGDGRLRLFNTDFACVQVAEADGERRYGSLVKMRLYRRTIALVKISETDCYVVDIFRVKGGKTHDYMLHSCLDCPHKVMISIPLTGKPRGSLHKYIKNLHSARSDDAWSATFTLDNGSAALRTFFLPQQGTEIIQGTGPAMRRLGTAPFIAVRQSDGDSVFAAVHHPFVGKPVIQQVEPVELVPSDASAVALRVTLPDRVDTIISTMDAKPWQDRRTEDGRIEMRGRFAHVAASGKGNAWCYLVDGDHLRVGDISLEGEISYSGVLNRTLRVEAGDGLDAFGTTAALPTDGSLNGGTLMVDIGGLLVQSFRIKKIERTDNTTLIHSLDEPGMTITPNLVKLEYYPCWGIRGKAKFRIAGSARLRMSDKGKWLFSGSGSVSATVKGKTVTQSSTSPTQAP